MGGLRAPALPHVCVLQSLFISGVSQKRLLRVDRSLDPPSLTLSGHGRLRPRGVLRWPCLACCTRLLAALVLSLLDALLLLAPAVAAAAWARFFIAWPLGSRVAFGRGSGAASSRSLVRASVRLARLAEGRAPQHL